MRDYAKFKPGFWTGDFGAEIRGNPYAQALGAYLITNPHSNMIGLYRLPSSYIIEDLGWPEKSVLSAMQALEKAGFCRYDWTNKALWVCELARHEWGEEPNIKDLRVKSLSRTAPKILSDLHRSPLVAAFLKRYGRGWEDVLEALGKPLASPTEQDLEALAKQESESESESEQEEEQMVAPTRPARARKWDDETADIFGHYKTCKLRWYEILRKRPPKEPEITEPEREAIVKRLRDGYSADKLKAALDHVEHDAWLMGKAERCQRAQLSLTTIFLVRTNGQVPLNRVEELLDKTEPDREMRPLLGQQRLRAV